MTKRKRSEAIAGLDDDGGPLDAAADADESAAAVEDLVRLSVGGQLFVTRWRTLCSQNALEPNFFNGLFAFQTRYKKKKKEGANTDFDVFIDRSPALFEIVLDYLRSGVLSVPPTVSRSRVNIEMTYYMVNWTPTPVDFDESLYERRIKPHRPLLERIAAAVVKGFHQYAEDGFGGSLIVAFTIGLTNPPNPHVQPTDEQIASACERGLLCGRVDLGGPLPVFRKRVPIACLIDKEASMFLMRNHERNLLIEFLEREHGVKARMKQLKDVELTVPGDNEAMFYADEAQARDLVDCCFSINPTDGSWEVTEHCNHLIDYVNITTHGMIIRHHKLNAHLDYEYEL